jgi:hypothetical protein
MKSALLLFPMVGSLTRTATRKSEVYMVWGCLRPNFATTSRAATFQGDVWGHFVTPRDHDRPMDPSGYVLLIGYNRSPSPAFPAFPARLYACRPWIMYAVCRKLRGYWACAQCYVTTSSFGELAKIRFQLTGFPCSLLIENQRPILPQRLSSPNFLASGLLSYE